jgi:hypothetical protein
MELPGVSAKWKTEIWETPENRIQIEESSTALISNLAELLKTLYSDISEANYDS